jgi:hypothetical protein
MTGKPAFDHDALKQLSGDLGLAPNGWTEAGHDYRR